MTREEVIAGVRARFGDVTDEDWERRLILMVFPSELLEAEPEEVESAFLSEMPPDGAVS